MQSEMDEQDFNNSEGSDQDDVPSSQPDQKMEAIGIPRHYVAYFYKEFNQDRTN